MSASNERTERHLTPEGWMPGQSELDFTGIKGSDKLPQNRVLTCLYEECQSSSFKGPDKTVKILWACADMNIINKLKKKYGECPTHIHSQF